MSKRVLAIALAILAFFIFVGSPFQQAAEAVALVDDAVIAIIIAALAACGIVFTTTGAYNNVKDYVRSLFGQYCNSQGMTQSDALKGIDYGRNKLGQILLNNRFVRLIQAFGYWLKYEFGLSNNSSTDLVQPGFSLGSLKLFPMPAVGKVYAANDNWVPSYITAKANGVPVWDIYIIWVGYNYSPMLLTKTQYANGEVTLYCTNDYDSYVYEAVIYRWNDTYQGYLISPWYEADFSNGRFMAADSTTIYTSQQVVDALASGGEIVENDVAISIDTGVMTLPYDDPDYDEGDGAILDVGAVWGATLPDILSEEIPTVFDEDEISSTTLEYESEDVVQEEVEESQQDVINEEVSQDVADYQVNGLADVFPFCIPFDIYAFFECLAAEPEAPAFTWRFYIPGICDEEIEIDLAAFDSAARILRTMELLLFIVGLAFVTRDKFLRG